MRCDVTLLFLAWLGSVGTMLLAPVPVQAARPDTVVTVIPVETEEILANPGMGWQTFHRTKTQDQNLPSWIPSTVHYARWGWGTLEPEKGKTDNDFIDASMPKPETQKQIVDAYLAAFQQTPLVMLIGGGEMLKHATEHGTGWRADCLGDMGGFSKTWCHMRMAYPQRLPEADAMDAWKTAPVAWETCWDMRKWVEERWSLRFIFNYALALHGSVINNKSAPLPEGENIRPEVERFLRRLGYRLVLKELKHPSTARSGEKIPLAMKWQNVGSAPCYSPYRVAYRLSNDDGYEKVIVGEVTVNKWFPGSIELFTEEFFKQPADLPPGQVHDVADTIVLPKDIPAGEYVLSVGVVGAEETQPVVQLGIEGRDDDGWYPLSEVKVQRPAAAIGAGDHTRTIEVAGRNRSYLVHIPEKYDPKTPTPVILVLHGAGTNAQIMVPFCAMSKKSDEAGFITVYPNGTGAAGVFLTWNAGGLPGKMAEGKADDTEFVRRLLDNLKNLINLDPKRIYATGMSNGGMMCYRLAAELSDRIAAIAPVAGTMAIVDAKPSRPVPIMHFHGTADRIVPFGGPGNSTPKFLSFKSVKETVGIWAKLNKCKEEPVVEKLEDKAEDGTTVTEKTYAPKKGGAEVVLIEIEGGGHTWPGVEPPVGFIGRSTKDVAANDMIWDFFQRHRLP